MINITLLMNIVCVHGPVFGDLLSNRWGSGGTDMATGRKNTPYFTLDYCTYSRFRQANKPTKTLLKLIMSDIILE